MIFIAMLQVNSLDNYKSLHPFFFVLKPWINNFFFQLHHYVLEISILSSCSVEK